MTSQLIKIILTGFLFLTSCNKQDDCSCSVEQELNANLSQAQQQELLQTLLQRTHDSIFFSKEERQFFEQIRTQANNVESYYEGVNDNQSLEEKYIILKRNIRYRINDIAAQAQIFYHNKNSYTTLTKNLFVLMTYDAFQRNRAEMLWTNLGIFAANEVRAGVVLAFNVAELLKQKNIHIPIGTAKTDLADVLIQSTELLIEGQLNVVVDIGALVLLNKYIKDAIPNETRWLTQEAINGFVLQKQAEDALRCNQIIQYQDIQTQAAIQFGAHEQIYILQPLWNKPLLQQFSQINQWILKLSNGQLAFFGEIFIGANKYKESKNGQIIKIPTNSYNLVSAIHRVDIARNGFNTYNILRKQTRWQEWINHSQLRLGYALDIYYPTSDLNF